MWDEMLSPQPIALISPFVRLRIPDAEDRAAIQAKTSHAYITRHPEASPQRVTGGTRRTLAETGAYRVLDYDPGHIRVRVPLSGDPDWQVECFNGATRL
jgi:hypothetical protein